MKAAERTAIGLAALLVALALYNGANVLTDHLGAADFPDHAKFHAALGGAYMLLLSVLAAVVVWSADLRRAARGLLLAGVLIAIPLGFLWAVAMVPSGSPGLSYVALALVGLGISLVVGALLLRSARD